MICSIALKLCLIGSSVPAPITAGAVENTVHSGSIATSFSGVEIALVMVASQRPRAEGGSGSDQGKPQRPDKAIGPDQMMGLMKEARTLTDVRVEELRTRLNGDPKDMEARLLLIFHAMSSRTDRSSPAVVSLLLGLIENHPTNPLSSELPRMLANGPQYDQAAKTWLAVVKDHENDATVLGNAGAFLTGAILNTTYRDQGEAFLKKARSLEPTQARWVIALGTVYEMDMVRSGPTPSPARTTAARNALKEFEAAYQLTPEPERAKLRPEGRHIYEHIAVTAMACGDTAKAGAYAEKLLATVKPEQDSWNYGNAIFEAHTLLGRVALSQNDIQAAERHLLESGRTPGSPQLNSFGPNMILADQLLECGSNKSVLEFLDLCGKFWTSGKDRIARWSQDIRDGKKPEFGTQSRP